MAGVAPDSTALFNLSSVAATDDALKALLGTAAGKTFRVAPEHFLAKSAKNTPVYKGTVGTDVTLSWPHVDWLVARACDITALASLRASWRFRPAFLSQFFMNLQKVGGALPSEAANEGVLAEAIVKAAAAMPKVKATPADVIVLDAFATGTWLDAALTASFTSEDGKGRPYAQMQACFGFCCSPAEALALTDELAQVKWTFQPLVGDIQGLSDWSLAAPAPTRRSAWRTGRTTSRGAACTAGLRTRFQTPR